ncbi:MULTISPECIES: cytochrome aa3 quinol oxidase subunit IV [Heyndrickxia]|uniref:cytochrome aa3 quinol oxidase subunit IV n=1 Tax=Heyndrickxia TaxID=2837504 RepID=UPI0021B3E73A|nr:MULTISPECIES: cytochrome aa3 quinol oxidase subunit IV [Heyndrickxia]MED4867869.1 cytochrome aa3 quinol oxidase subunit IV [Weizmannia sp. CD-2023]UXC23084.1 cytochrome aa3 quinol oxidase subunit IV [Heyndrickxia coagulans]WMM89481.1 cytochrome aa3 quinol oxidase subunit IV [Heyndrickxia coagulans]
MEHHSKYPIGHVIGFLLSIVLTLVALYVALYTNLSKTAIIWTIGLFAFLQAGVQLFMFMHVKEGESGKINVGNMIYSIIIAIVVVYGTIWVMHF